MRSRRCCCMSSRKMSAGVNRLPRTPKNCTASSRAFWKPIVAVSVNHSIRTDCDFATPSAAISPSCRETFRSVPERPNRRFQMDQSHSGLQFKQLHSSSGLWSVRVTESYRAVGVRNGDEIVWLFIGTHADYERLLAKL